MFQKVSKYIVVMYAVARLFTAGQAYAGDDDAVILEHAHPHEGRLIILPQGQFDQVNLGNQWSRAVGTDLTGGKISAISSGNVILFDQDCGGCPPAHLRELGRQLNLGNQSAQVNTSYATDVESLAASTGNLKQLTIGHH